jgi:hypothetical protein
MLRSLSRQDDDIKLELAVDMGPDSHRLALTEDI